MSGPAEDRSLPADLYRHLSTDLGANGCKVATDLAGERLEAVAGGPDLIQVSHEELIEDGRAKSEDAEDLVKAMRAVRDGGAGTIVVPRAGSALALALLGDGDDDDGKRGKDIVEIGTPTLEPADSADAGDSMTAGIVARWPAVARWRRGAAYRRGLRGTQRRAAWVGHRRRAGR
ncbi:hypothetical protein [Mycolicibacterium holsaticum]|uniref:hypothetical protein n=1 Tax=Mycolicibacterium holsaticum TaxID=152142 RepID=UPI001E4A78DB|nr:hypothetical protein [Mycolicibacterium holsaticum]